MDIGRKGSLLILTIVFAAMLAVFNLATARMVASGKADRLIHRDTIVHGDGARLYAYLRSAWFDGDVDTANELDYYFNYPGSREPDDNVATSTGYAWNHTPVGCAILWSPFFLMGHMTAVQMRHAAIAIGTHVYCFLGALILFLICSRYYSIPASLLAAITVWLASFLPAYLFLYPSMSHAQSFFSVSLFIWLWLEAQERWGPALWCLLGIAGGVAALVRTQNVIFLCIPVLWTLGAKQPIPIGHRLRNTAIMAAFALAAFSPQMYVWKLTYGSFLTIPQGGGFLHWTRPAAWEVLFSSRHGLLTWSPALILGCMGLPAFVKRERLLGLSLLLVFLFQLYLNSIVDDWWAGTGFGARRFDNCLPIFALGIAAVYEWMRLKRIGWLAVIITAGAIVWNGLFLCQYALNWVSHMNAIDMGKMARDQERMFLYIISRIRSI
ncbi:MAG: hypothetical protein P8123_01940 [bacterium]